jgi:hypothetical protein
MTLEIIDGDWVFYNPGVKKYIGKRQHHDETEYFIVDQLFQAAVFPDNIIARRELRRLIDTKPLWRNFTVARIWFHVNY